MSAQGNWPGKLREKDLPDVEARLEAMLRPVAPRQEYIQDLERRLILSRNEPYGIISNSELLQITFMVVLSLLGSSILIALGVRVLLAFIGGLGVAQQLQARKERSEISKPPNTL